MHHLAQAGRVRPQQEHRDHHAGRHRGHQRRAGQLPGHASAATPALRRRQEVQRLRRLRRGLPRHRCPTSSTARWARARRSSGRIRRRSRTSTASPRSVGRSPCKAVLPGRRERAGLRGADRPGQVQGSLRPHPRAVPAAGGLRPRLPASLRDEVQPQRARRAGRRRATSSGSRPTTSTPTGTSSRTTRAPAVAQQKEKVAIVGGGPAGLTAAADLRAMGYGVTIFDAKPKLGGMLRYGIPRYRLPDDVLDREIQYLLDHGRRGARLNTRVADPAKLLKADRTGNGNGSGGGEFDAVFVAIGAWISRKLGIPGEDAQGVWPGLKFLHDVNSGEQPADRAERAGHRRRRRGHGRRPLRPAPAGRRERPPGLPGSSATRCPPTRGKPPRPSKKASTSTAASGPTKIVDRRRQGHRRGLPRLHARLRRRTSGSPRSSTMRRRPSLAADTVIVTIGQGIDAERAWRRGDGPAADASRPTARRWRPTSPASSPAATPCSARPRWSTPWPRATAPPTAIDAFLRGATRQAAADAPRPSRRRTGARIPTPDAPRTPRQQDAAGPGRPSALRRLPRDRPGLHARGRPSPRPSAAWPAACAASAASASRPARAGAIIHDMQPTTETLNVGSVILTPGFEEFQASALRGEFGHGRYANVLSQRAVRAAAERGRPDQRRGAAALRRQAPASASRSSSASARATRRAATATAPRSAACRPPRKRWSPWSTRHGLEVSIFCMDIRAFGKEFDSYVNRARDEHKRQVHPRDPVAHRRDAGHEEPAHPLLRRERRGAAAGVRPGGPVGRPAAERERQGHGRAARAWTSTSSASAETDRLAPMAASRPGIYVAGRVPGTQGHPRIGRAGVGRRRRAPWSSWPSARGTLIQRHEYPWERDVVRRGAAHRRLHLPLRPQHRLGGGREGGGRARAAQMPNVVHAEASLYTCSDTNQQHIKDMIREHRLNRLVVASCSPRTHEILFQETLRESGLNQYLFAMTNIRDQCSWVHRDDPVAATEKAVDLMRMAVGRARHLKALRDRPAAGHAVGPGGRRRPGRHDRGAGGGRPGLSRCTWSRRRPQLGGNLRHIHYTLERRRRAAVPGATWSSASRRTRRSRVTSTSQVAADRRPRRQLQEPHRDVGGKEKPISHGVTIIATGGVERETDLYLHGKNPRVVTQRELEEQLAAGGLPKELGDKPDHRDDPVRRLAQRRAPLLQPRLLLARPSRTPSRSSGSGPARGSSSWPRTSAPTASARRTSRRPARRASSSSATRETRTRR